MCGIVGYVGQRPVQEILLEGLEKLEYRGYDSAGITVQGEDGLDAIRAVGNLAQLRDAVEARDDAAGGSVAVLAPPATTGIGHTRWATHGRVSEENAHPHFDTADRVHVVVNGIVENYMELKQELVAAGAVFTSETDAEVIAHLVSRHLDGDGLEEAVRRAYAQLRGHYAFVAIAADEPGVIVAARKECPLVVGRGDGEQFLGSAIPAFLAHTRHVQLIENEEIVTVTADDVRFTRADGTPVERAIEEVDWSEEVAEKGGYETFMLKEIHEQADAVAETIADRTARGDGVDLDDLGMIDDEVLRSARRVDRRRLRHLVPRRPDRPLRDRAVGARRRRDGRRERVPLPRPRDRARRPRDRHLAVRRDGRHARRDAARPRARRHRPRAHQRHGLAGDARRRRRAVHALGARGLGRRDQDVRRPGLGDVPARPADGRAARHARARAARGARPRPQADARTASRSCSRRSRSPSTAWREAHYEADFFLYLGRHVGLPVALEGALKLKEISYIATDAYAAGEMKHGPIALLDDRTPVVCVATDSPVLEKVISNMQEVRARGAHVIAVATEGNEEIAAHAEEVLRVPRTDWMLQPLLAVIPLQLLAYRIARLRGLNVDQPRNLAKTVTVE